MERSLSFQAKREVLRQIAPQYRQASASQKQTLLEAFIAITGYVRKYARWLLNHAEEAQPMDGRYHPLQIRTLRRGMRKIRAHPVCKPLKSSGKRK